MTTGLTQGKRLIRKNRTRGTSGFRMSHVIESRRWHISQRRDTLLPPQEPVRCLVQGAKKNVKLPAASYSCVEIGSTASSLRHTEILRQILQELKATFDIQGELPPNTPAAEGMLPGCLKAWAH